MWEGFPRECMDGPALRCLAAFQRLPYPSSYRQSIQALVTQPQIFINLYFYIEFQPRYFAINLRSSHILLNIALRSFRRKEKESPPIGVDRGPSWDPHSPAARTAKADTRSASGSARRRREAEDVRPSDDDDDASGRIRDEYGWQIREKIGTDNKEDKGPVNLQLRPKGQCTT